MLTPLFKFPLFLFKEKPSNYPRSLTAVAVREAAMSPRSRQLPRTAVPAESCEHGSRGDACQLSRGGSGVTGEKRSHSREDTWHLASQCPLLQPRTPGPVGVTTVPFCLVIISPWLSPWPCPPPGAKDGHVAPGMASPFSLSSDH